MSNVKSALLVGVGGQGAILISKIMSNGFMQAGFDVKQSEVHGMAQRGGSVSTQVRWGDKVYGPVFGKGEADIMVALEKMEAVRYAEFLKPDGVAVINDYAIKSTTIASGAETYPPGLHRGHGEGVPHHRRPRQRDRPGPGQRQVHERGALRRHVRQPGLSPDRLGAGGGRYRPRKGEGTEHPGLPGRTGGRPEVPVNQ